MLTKQMVDVVHNVCPDYRGRVVIEIEGEVFNPGVITDIIPGDPHVDTVIETGSIDPMGVRQFLEQMAEGDPEGDAQLYHKGERYEAWYDAKDVSADGQTVTVHAGDVRCVG